MRRPLLLLTLPLLLGAGNDPSRHAKADLAELVSDDDYPPSAVRAGAQGTVGFTLDVAADGHVTGCAIESSSGSTVLDNQTCRLLIARARFTPARDSKGHPTSDTVHNRIRWVLPQDETEANNQEAPPPP
jgi:protein TonB